MIIYSAVLLALLVIEFRADNFALKGFQIAGEDKAVIGILKVRKEAVPVPLVVIISASVVTIF